MKIMFKKIFFKINLVAGPTDTSSFIPGPSWGRAGPSRTGPDGLTEFFHSENLEYGRKYYIQNNFKR